MQKNPKTKRTIQKVLYEGARTCTLGRNYYMPYFELAFVAIELIQICNQFLNHRALPIPRKSTFERIVYMIKLNQFLDICSLYQVDVLSDYLTKKKLHIQSCLRVAVAVACLLFAISWSFLFRRSSELVLWNHVLVLYLNCRIMSYVQL